MMSAVTVFPKEVRGVNTMIVVTLKEGEPIDRALRRFKLRCQRAGVHRDAKRASFYLKPSEKKKLAKNLARKRYRKMRTT